MLANTRFWKNNAMNQSSQIFIKKAQVSPWQSFCLGLEKSKEIVIE